MDFLESILTPWYNIYVISQRTLTWFVGVVSLHNQHHTTCCVMLVMEPLNFHKHSPSPLTYKDLA